jgi:hypothetical protein
MARVLHPKLFPECSSSLLIPESLERSMEAYWRVKKWRISATFKYSEEFQDSVSFDLDISSPQFGTLIDTETKLVCSGTRSNEIPSGDYVDLADGFLMHTAFGLAGPYFEFNFGEFGTISGPVASDDTVLPSPMTFQMGSYSRTMYAEGGNQGNLTSTISLTALEWWEYRDANGENPLYDKDTGEPID